MGRARRRVRWRENAEAGRSERTARSARRSHDCSALSISIVCDNPIRESKAAGAISTRSAAPSWVRAPCVRTGGGGSVATARWPGSRIASLGSGSSGLAASSPTHSPGGPKLEQTQRVSLDAASLQNRRFRAVPRCGGCRQEGDPSDHAGAPSCRISKLASHQREASTFRCRSTEPLRICRSDWVDWVDVAALG